MTRKRDKAFDCVQMKRSAQDALRNEYESRKSEFGSYVEFLNAKATEEQWQRELLASIRTSEGVVAGPEPPSRDAEGR